MLEAKALTKTFGATRALDGLDLTVERGEVMCLLGANGAGKTTTINLFLGFLEPTSGQALVGGQSASEAPDAVRRQTLYIPEQIALYGELTGLENLDYFAALGGVEDRSERRLLEALTEAGLDLSASRRRASGYSKGMRQKVGVALAIVKNAGALLLDEPTSGLDPKASADFHDLVARQRDRGAAILMATHDLFRAREVGDRIGVMRAGRLRRVIPASDVTAVELEKIYLEEMAAEAEHGAA